MITTYLENSDFFDIKDIRSFIAGDNKANPKEQTKTIINADNVFEWFDKKIALCKCNKQFGSAESYTSTKNVLKEYFKVSDIALTFLQLIV